MLKTVPIRGYAGISLCKVLVTATCFGLIDRRIEPPGDTPDSRGQVRSDPQVAQFFVMFCGAGSSPPGVSTAVARALGKGSAALALAVMRLACSPARIDRPASRLGDSVEPVTPAKVDHPESRDTAESQDKLLSAMRYQFGGHMKKRAGN